MNSMNNFLKTKKGLKFLLHITAEYGKWNEVKQCYDMPVKEAIEVASEESLPTLNTYKTGVIYLTGDKELEAVDNYMLIKHNKSIYDIVPVTDVKAFACNFLTKYSAEVALVKDEYGRVFYYPRFK